jgi:hypothetical protein
MWFRFRGHFFCDALDAISHIESAACGGQAPFRDTLGSSALLLDRRNVA